jgi:hypothetical protein
VIADLVVYLLALPDYIEISRVDLQHATSNIIVQELKRNAGGKWTR